MDSQKFHVLNKIIAIFQLITFSCYISMALKIQAMRAQYETARTVSIAISFFGWFVFVGGVFVAFSGITSILRAGYDTEIFIIAVLPGIGTVVSGLLLVAAGQVVKSTADSAENTSEILSLIKDKSNN